MSQAMEPKFASMTEQHKEEIRRLKDKIGAQDRALSQQEEHTIQLRQRLLQVFFLIHPSYSYLDSRRGRIAWRKKDFVVMRNLPVRKRN